jgi:acyl-CoA synthetase (AMP-forming)/AMP-acid ligase II
MLVPEVPYEPSIPVVVRRAVVEFGAQDLVVMPDRSLSVADAERASRRLAKELLASGVGKGTRVAVHLPTGPEWVVAFLAAARIGALVMPYSTLYRPAELRKAMRFGDVSVLLTASTMLGKDHEAFLEEAIPGLASSTASHLRIAELPYLRSVRLLGASTRSWADRSEITPELADDDVDGVDDAMLESVEAEVRAADPLLVVFTSGTTADPKGVIHTHGTVVRKTAPMVGHALDASFPGRPLCLLPFFWVGGLQAVVGALQSGATILTIEKIEAERALALARREGATSFNGNFTTLTSLFGSPDGSNLGLTTLRPLPKRPWEGPPNSKGQPPTPFGMTETFGPWGGIDSFDVRVVDPETGRDVAVGEEGEYWVRGYAVTAGLYKREREETFTPDGFYRTGDLGSFENGQVYFRTRLNDMIKRKGANVAPAEVEEALKSFPEVRVAIVAGLPHAEFGQEVAAAIVPEAGHSVEAEELRERLRGLISPYKVPTVYLELGEADVPYLPSSKLDKRAIVAMLLAHRDGESVPQ